MRSLVHQAGGHVILHEEWAKLIEELLTMSSGERQLAARYVADHMRKHPERWPPHACGPRQLSPGADRLPESLAPVIRGIHTGHLTPEHHRQTMEQLSMPGLKLDFLAIDPYSLDAQAVREIFALPSTSELRTLHIKGITLHSRPISDQSHPLHGLQEIAATRTIEELVIHNVEGNDSILLSSFLEELPKLHTLGIHGGMYQARRWHRLCRALKYAHKLRHLNLSRAHHCGEAIAQMAKLGLLDSLESLSAGYNVQEDSLLHLCESLNERLHTLQITGSAFQKESLKALRQALFLPALEQLSVKNVPGVPTVELVRALDEVGIYRTLRRLELKHVGLGPLAMQVLCEGRAWLRLKHLAIPYNAMRDDGLKYLTQCKIPHLQSLDLTWNKLSQEALRELAQGAHLCWPELRQLALAQNLEPMTDEERRSIERLFEQPVMLSWRK